MRSGPGWNVVMPAHYGYFKGTVARDKDHVDAYIGPNENAQTAWVIDQIDPDTKRYDEPKVMIGFNSEEEARRIGFCLVEFKLKLFGERRPA